jgi:hypothetical protein
MKFMIPFVMAMLPVAAVAQSQSGTASGVPDVAIPPTTGYWSFRLPGRA